MDESDLVVDVSELLGSGLIVHHSPHLPVKAPPEDPVNRKGDDVLS